MRTRLLITITVLLCSACDVVAANSTCILPDGWKYSDVWLYGGQVEVGVNEETVYVPPYYYSMNQDGKTYSSCVVTSIKGYYDPNGGWMVKAPKKKGGNNGPKKLPTLGPAYDWNVASPGAFKGCTAMKKLILPPTIKTIKQLAFSGCAIDELVCMAITPPEVVDGSGSLGGGTSLGNCTIGKIVVPTGTLAAYKSAAQWKDFKLVEGAETYSNNQMVEHNGAWYEVVNGEATLINTEKITDGLIPNTLKALIKGEWKTIPVKSISPWAVSKDITLGANIPDIPDNWYDGGSLSFTNDHPTYRQLAPNVVTNKGGTIAYYIFKTANVPHGVTSIANNALNYCSTAYLPRTLNFIGAQTSKTTLYFTSEQPPSTSMTSYSGARYVSEDYVKNYTQGAFSATRTWDIPGGYEYFSDNAMVAYWNTQNKDAILKEYTVQAEDVDVNGVITLPAKFNNCLSQTCSIKEYDIKNLNKVEGVSSINKVRIPEGIKTFKTKNKSGYYYTYPFHEIYLPSTLEECGPLSGYSELSVIDINPANPKLDSRDNCNAVIETATNTLLTGCSTTTIPSTVEHISENAFKGLSYAGNTISIPASVKTIGKHAFENLWGSSPIQIEFAPGSALTCIEDSVFYGAQISTVNIPNKVESIGTGSFGGCGNLKEVALGNSLKEIGMRAFYGCYNLADVSFGSSLKEIGDYAFRGCALTSLTFPDALERIGEEAFYGMPTLESITFGKSLKEIGTKAFGSCGITSLILPDALEKVGNYAFSNVSTLETIKFGKNLKEIGSYAFSSCGIKTLTLPDALEKINSYAFSKCNGMTSVSIGKSLKNIDENAFRDCDALQKVIVKDIASWFNMTFGNNYANPLYYAGHLYSDENTEIKDLVFPSSMTSISGKALTYCTGLTSVTIPSSVTSIEKGAFSNCTGLSSVTIDSNSIMTNTSRENTISSIFGTQVKKYIIGNNVTTIGDYAFDECSGLKSVSIPNTVTTIGGCAFWGCSGLTSVTIPNSVTTIGGRAFYGCALKSVTLPNSVTSIGFAAFESCTALKSVTFSNSVSARSENTFGGNRNQQPTNNANNVTVGDYAFSKCTSLTSINLPDNITSIGERAFYQCTGLASVTIGNGLKIIGKQAFMNCDIIETIRVAQGNNVYDSRNNCNAIIKTATDELILGCKNTLIPNNVKAIGYCAFYDCIGLTSINIPNSVTSISSSAFSVCKGLTSITIPNSVTRIGSSAFSGCSSLTSIEIPNGVTSIENEVFWGCTSLKSVSIPDGVSSIGNDAFRECSSLTSIKIPTSVTEIGQYAFFECSGLTSITIPNSVKSIEGATFHSCTGLTSITIPNSVNSIGSSAFYGCKGLTSVTIGNSVMSIGSYVFQNCTGLTDVYCLPKDIPSLGENALYNANIDNATLHVPATSLSAYQETERWSQFARIVPLTDEEMTDIKSIRNSQFTIENEAGAWYTLDGRKMSGKPAQKGIYIHNGKKVAIK